MNVAALSLSPFFDFVLKSYSAGIIRLETKCQSGRNRYGAVVVLGPRVAICDLGQGEDPPDVDDVPIQVVRQLDLHASFRLRRQQLAEGVHLVVPLKNELVVDREPGVGPIFVRQTGYDRDHTFAPLANIVPVFGTQLGRHRVRPIVVKRPTDKHVVGDGIISLHLRNREAIHVLQPKLQIRARVEREFLPDPEVKFIALVVIESSAIQASVLLQLQRVPGWQIQPQITLNLGIGVLDHAERGVDVLRHNRRREAATHPVIARTREHQLTAQNDRRYQHQTFQ